MKLNDEQLRFFYHEVLGEIGWCDEDEEAGTDPLTHVLGEIRKMRKEIECPKIGLQAGLFSESNTVILERGNERIKVTRR